MRRFAIIVLVGILLVRLGTMAMAGDRAEILWDRWGVPHIFASSEGDLFKAFGWSQAQSHGDLILRLYGRARGKAAEYWGIAELESDRYVHNMGIPARAQNWYESQTPAMRSNLDAFAEGINTFARTHPDAIQSEVQQVLPVTGIDILAHVQRSIYFHLLIQPSEIANLETAEKSGGSMAWAIAPPKAAGGGAMLLANPHLPWSGFWLWYEAHLTAPGVNVYGATLVGMPVMAIAFNDDLGWTVTLNTVKGADIYALTRKEDGYLWDGKVEPFRSESYRLKIRQSDGRWSEAEFSRQTARAGTIIRQEKDKAYALRVVGLDRPFGLEQLWNMAKSRDRQGFERALSQLQVPLFTFLYGDGGGDILFVHNALIPVRKGGDWPTWQRIVPIDRSADLWTDYHSYRDLPRLLNPPSGWLQNTNDPPWSSTFPFRLDPADYPAYFAPPNFSTSRSLLRTQRSLKFLKDLQQLSLEEAIDAKFSSRLELADRILEFLIPTARNLANPIGIEAANVLDAWDRQAAPTSRGAVLFTLWALTLSPDRAFSRPWSAEDPLATPTGLADINQSLAVLEGVAAQIKLLYGSLDVAWGDVVEMRAGSQAVAANGAPGQLGTLRVLDIAATADERWQVVAGDSFMMAIDFNDLSKTRGLMAYGNASQPGSPHVGDQLEFYARGEMRSIWRDRMSIEKNLETRETLP